MSNNIWKIYCITEDGWIYHAGTDAPIKCPNNKHHTINQFSSELVTNKTSSSSVNSVIASSRTLQRTPSVRDIVNTLDIDAIRDINKFMYFDKRTVLFDLKSFYQLSLLKNIVTSHGNGNAKCDPHLGSEIKLRVEKSGDYIGLQSAERGQYIAGYRCEAGLGIRIPNNLNDKQVFKWGYYDDFNGYYFKLEGTQFYVCILNTGIETAIHSSEFNCCAGGNTIFKDGNIFKINFSWYGFGNIIFGIYRMDPKTLVYNFVPFHSYQPRGATSTSNPNLPINAQLFNGNSTTASDVYIAGRQFSIIGNVTIKSRSNMFYTHSNVRKNQPKIVFSLKKKNTMLGCKNKITEIKIEPRDDILLQIYTNKAITSENFIENIGYSTESSVLVDAVQTTTQRGDGLLYWSGTYNKGSYIIDVSNSNILMIEDQPLSFVVTGLSGDEHNMVIQVTWAEEW
jgi:hypothetical protein